MTMRTPTDAIGVLYWILCCPHFTFTTVFLCLLCLDTCARPVDRVVRAQDQYTSAE